MPLDNINYNNTKNFGFYIIWYLDLPNLRSHDYYNKK